MLKMDTSYNYRMRSLFLLSIIYNNPMKGLQRIIIDIQNKQVINSYNPDSKLIDDINL